MRAALAFAPLLAALGALPALAGTPRTVFPVDAKSFAVLARDSGPRNYYRVLEEQGEKFVRGVYAPPLKTVTLFAELPDALRRGVKTMKWRWRVLAFPKGGDECTSGLGDGAANVYVTWKSGLKWYSLKLVWSTAATPGATCNKIRNPFVTSDSIILRSGGRTGQWVEEEIDPDALFREHFEGGNPKAEVPELQGIGFLTDGDQTRSASAADYGGFVLSK